MEYNFKNNKTKVCHLTSAHQSDDTRIFHKECISLKKYYDVFLIAHGSSYTRKGITVIGLGEKPNSRFRRMYFSTRKVYKAALALDADIYHLHDPELLPYATKLKKKGKKVIFDSHEDYLSTITEKKWIPSFLRKSISKLFSVYESKVISKIDGAIVCYHWTEDRYKKANKNVKMILNYPIITNEEVRLPNYEMRKIAFAGGISSQWCHKEIIESLSNLKDVNYELAGMITDSYGKELQELDGWKYVNYHGVLQLEEVKSKVYNNSAIGMALLDYIAQCKGKIGNLSNTKFFEYMQMGLPLICTDFELWKEIIDEEQCGICVNPHNINEITEAIKFLLDNPKRAKVMGVNGQKAIKNKYNWYTEENKLFNLYNTIDS